MVGRASPRTRASRSSALRASWFASAVGSVGAAAPEAVRSSAAAVAPLGATSAAEPLLLEMARGGGTLAGAPAGVAAGVAAGVVAGVAAGVAAVALD